MDDFDNAAYDAECTRIVEENHNALFVEGEDHVSDLDGDGAAEMTGGCARRPQR